MDHRPARHRPDGAVRRHRRRPPPLLRPRGWLAALDGGRRRDLQHRRHRSGGADRLPHRRRRSATTRPRGTPSARRPWPSSSSTSWPSYFDEADSDALQGEVICYARAVVDDEWPAMQRGSESDRVQGWVDAMDDSMREAHGGGPEAGGGAGPLVRREQRPTGGAGERGWPSPSRSCPGFLWAALILISIVVLGYQLLMIDPKVRVVGQAYSMAAMAITVFAALAVVYMVDRPFNDRGAAIPHTRMSAALGVMERTAPATLPCDAPAPALSCASRTADRVPGTQLDVPERSSSGVRVGGGRRSPRPRARGCAGTAPRWGGGTSRRALPRRSPPGRGPTPPG